MEMTKEMEDQYNELALSRKCKEVLKKQKEELEEAFRIANAHVFAEYEAEAKRVSELEDMLRTTALNEHLLTGAKTWDGGVEVKEFTILNYDEPHAFEWAKDHRMALKLDKTAFEKIVKTTPTEFDFVKIMKEPRAQLPKELVVKAQVGGG